MARLIKVRCYDGVKKNISNYEVLEQDIPNLLEAYRKAAIEYLNKNDVNNVIYAIKEHDERGEINYLKLYTQVSKNDEELNELKNTVNGEICVVYKKIIKQD